MRWRTLIIFAISSFLLVGCDGVDRFGANADQISEQSGQNMDEQARAFEDVEEQYREYLEMVDEVEFLRERNEELEEELFNLTENRDWGAESYEYFCDYGYDEISEATYNELCN
ncbi:hypothetical protein [Exiguobacterium chiriqhucha]|uniref:Uncharacterized protein n=1 Tax=Exiguobacterium chiriqhucha RW-2 TaxID=1345023 RepID=U1N248_9BACL|nr:hypothetical protein [Exiguobacterium chiriqhucha]ERG68046.1 hypothetical protein M467_12215 [Exiguobacterium chiriqhucha RW-2]